MADFRQFMLLMCAAFFFQVFAQLVAWVIMSVFNAEATNSMRISLFKKLQKMTIRYFDTHQDGKLLALFNSDIDNIFNALNGAIFDLVSQTILFVGTIVVMFAINVKLALVTMASTPIVVLIAFSVMKKARKYLDEQQEDISVLNGYINEQLNGERIILANGLQKSSIAGFVKKNDKLRKTMFRGQFYSGLMFPMMQGLSMLNLAIVISVGTLIVVESGMSLAVGMGLIVTFVQYSQTYFIPLINLTSFYSMIQLALTGAKRLSDVEAEKEEDEVSSGINMQGINESVALKDVHFSYEKGKEILHGINLTIPRGKTLALVGPTGSGKTTTMNLFSRFYDVDSGTSNLTESTCESSRLIPSETISESCCKIRFCLRERLPTIFGLASQMQPWKKSDLLLKKHRLPILSKVCRTGTKLRSAMSSPCFQKGKSN